MVWITVHTSFHMENYLKLHVTRHPMQTNNVQQVNNMSQDTRRCLKVIYQGPFIPHILLSL